MDRVNTYRSDITAQVPWHFAKNPNMRDKTTNASLGSGTTLYDGLYQYDGANRVSASNDVTTTGWGTAHGRLFIDTLYPSSPTVYRMGGVDTRNIDLFGNLRKDNLEVSGNPDLDSNKLKGMWSVQVAPTATGPHYTFLHVLQATDISDNVPDSTAVFTGSSLIAAAVGSTELAIFHSTGGYLTSGSATFPSGINGTYKVLITDLEPSGTYSVTLGSSESTQTASAQGVLYFTDIALSAGDSVLLAASDTTPPTLSSLTPADNATDVETTTNLTLQFNEAIGMTGTGYVRIYKASDDSVVEQINTATGAVTGSGTATITVNPSVTLEGGTAYYVKIDNTAFPDASGNDFVGISNATTWNFETAASLGENWLSGFSYRKQIVIDPAYVDADLTNFPLFVKIRGDADMGANAQADGEDIRFTTSTGNLLIPYERESWTVSSGSGSADFWVKVPSVAAAANTVIYLYYGSGSAVDGQDATNVWDASFKAVWHLDESGNGTLDEYRDSTANSNDGRGGGGTASRVPAQVTGKISRGQDFSGANADDYINYGTPAALTSSLNTFTVSAWIKSDVSTGTRPLIGWRTAVSTSTLWINAGDGKASTTLAASNYKQFTHSPTDVDDGSWHYMAFRVTGNAQTDISNATLYADGQSQTASTTISTSAPDAKDVFHLGITSNWYTFDGTIDEVRISDSVRSAEWLAFEYRNVVEADNEIAFGSEEEPPAPDTTPPAPSSFSPASASTIADATQTITFTTDENATCYLSLDGDESYAQMSDDTLCSGGGTTSQSCTTPDLGSDGAKTVYVACTDGTNADTADTNEALSYTLETATSSSSVPGAGGAAAHWRRLYEDGLAPPDFVEWWENGSQTAGGREGPGREIVLTVSSSSVASSSSTSSAPDAGLIASSWASSAYPVSLSGDYVSLAESGRRILFRDVPTAAWFAPSVASLLSKGIASGYADPTGNLLGVFGPANPVTYAEIAKMALEASGNPPSLPASPKNASARRHWASAYIAKAEELRLSLYAATLNLDAPATRGAVIQTLLETFDLPMVFAPNPYRDLPGDHPFASAILTATRLGLIQGDTSSAGRALGTVRPDDPINRAEVSKILSLLLQR